MKGRKLLRDLHRDIGYFFTGVVILYGISGLAVNHADDWNPDFIIERQQVELRLPASPEAISKEIVLANLEPLGETRNYKSFDFPSEKRIKIYMEDASIVARLGEDHGTYETIRRRPLFYESNRLHLDPSGWWLVFSDLFALGLIFLAISGLFLLKGRKGLAGRGKWLVAAGLAVPLGFLLIV